MVRFGVEAVEKVPMLKRLSGSCPCLAPQRTVCCCSRCLQATHDRAHDFQGHRLQIRSFLLSIASACFFDIATILKIFSRHGHHGFTTQERADFCANMGRDRRRYPRSNVATYSQTPPSLGPQTGGQICREREAKESLAKIQHTITSGRHDFKRG